MAHKMEARWGFLKNIVNIDRFFSAGRHAPAAAPHAGTPPPPPIAPVGTDAATQ